MTKALLTCFYFFFQPLSAGPEERRAEKQPPDSSRCHLFIDHENIWTFEMVQDGRRKRVPILNIITLTGEEGYLSPDQIHIYNKRGEEAETKRFSIDTGQREKPYLTPRLKILGHNFIGVDLVGSFEHFPEATRISIELGDHSFKLQPIGCLDFEALAEKINAVNVNSADPRADFQALEIEPVGQRRLISQ